MQRKGLNRYTYRPQEKRIKNGKTVTTKLPPVVVEIEDAIMKPLISGPDAKRFLVPQSNTYLLFPYRVLPNDATLMNTDELANEFPNAWKYLTGFEKELRDREGKKFNDDKWYRMGLTQNLDKQEMSKLLVPRLVARLGCFVDDTGKYYCDNVDVGGVVATREADLWFLAGILNAPVTNEIFSWLTKPFRGEYKSANKQFIAPLPIPKADTASRAGLTTLAKRLQEQSTSRIDLLGRLAERLGSTTRNNLPLEQLLPDVRPVQEIEERLPKSVPASGRKAWVDDERKAQEEAALARLDGMIRLDSELTVELANGKLSFLIDGIEAARLFVEPQVEYLVEAQWRCVSLDFTPTGKKDGQRLTDRLRKVAMNAEPAVAGQIIAIGRELAELSGKLRADEKMLHELTCKLFKLTPAERALVDASRGL